MYLTRLSKRLDAKCKSNDETVRRIAQSIAQRRAWDELPMLADALDDAGLYAQLAARCRAYDYNKLESRRLRELTRNLGYENERLSAEYNQASSSRRLELLNEWNRIRNSWDLIADQDWQLGNENMETERQVRSLCS